MNSPSTLSDSTSATPNAAPRGRGRPQIFTPEIAMAIVKCIRTYGLSDSHAGVLAGVSSSTVSRWKQASEEFHDLLEKARAEFELERVLALLEATRPDGSPDWRAQAWLLRNSSREGGRGRAVKPQPAAAPPKVENLPKNTPTPPIPATPDEGESTDAPSDPRPAAPVNATRVEINAKSFPKIPQDLASEFPPEAERAHDVCAPLSRVA